MPIDPRRLRRRRRGINAVHEENERTRAGAAAQGSGSALHNGHVIAAYATVHTTRGGTL